MGDARGEADLEADEDADTEALTDGECDGEALPEVDKECVGLPLPLALGVGAVEP